MAFILDMVLVTTLAFVVVHTAIALQVQLTGWIFHIVAALYLGLLPATPLQATPGKRMVGLRICDGTGRRIGVLRAVLRLVAFVPSIGIAGAGFIVAAFTPRRQALHDLAAGTFVVKRGATPAEIAQVAPPVSALNRLGLVLGFALLAFGVHTLWVTLDGRNRHDEAITLLIATYAYREEVEKALRSGAPMPVPTTVPRQARAMSARPDGTIVVEVSDDLAAGARLTFRPEGVPKGGYLWTCRAEGLRYVPAACRP
jgi:uncharacterized RDD family membrane protein YckC